ncbi:MAG TPA: PKD domain-containing protein [Candidatus Acetothermia bacterium]|nr:PKD domain-containing protein [Candidatus Acetothermia bacterium]
MRRGRFVVLVALGIVLGGCSGPEAGRPPTAGIWYSPWRGEVPLLVSFVSQSVPGDAAIVVYRWEFGDGVVHEGEGSVSHWYAREGTFYPTLTVIDEAGRSATVRGVIQPGVSYPLDVLEWNVEATYFGQRVVGRVKNIGDRTINEGRVVVQFRDKDWNVVRERSKILGDLAPGVEQIFEITTDLTLAEIGGAPHHTIYTEVIHTDHPLSLQEEQ